MIYDGFEYSECAYDYTGSNRRIDNILTLQPRVLAFRSAQYFDLVYIQSKQEIVI